MIMESAEAHGGVMAPRQDGAVNAVRAADWPFPIARVALRFDAAALRANACAIALVTAPAWGLRRS